MPWRSSVRSMRALDPMRRKLFPQAPKLILASYCQIGRTATRHTAGRLATLVAVKIDNRMRLRLIAHTTTATTPRIWTLRSKFDAVLRVSHQWGRSRRPQLPLKAMGPGIRVALGRAMDLLERYAHDTSLWPDGVDPRTWRHGAQIVTG
jgi:hypothetical protein